MNIFVGSLPFKIQEEEVRKEFEKFGAVLSVKIITDRFTGRSKGFGFVEMPDDDQAQKAIDGLNGTSVGGRTIVVNKAEERKPREGGRGNFGRRGGHGYRDND